MVLRCGIALQRRSVGSVSGLVALAWCWASWRCIAVSRMTALRWIGVGLATSFWQCIAALLVDSRCLIGMLHCVVTLRCVAVLCRGVAVLSAIRCQQALLRSFVGYLGQVQMTHEVHRRRVTHRHDKATSAGL